MSHDPVRLRAVQDYLKAIETGTLHEDAAAFEDPQDRRFHLTLLKGMARHRGMLERLAAARVERLDKLRPAVTALLALGFHQLLHLDRVPHHAAVNETVALAVPLMVSRQAGLVNAVLRGVLRDLEAGGAETLFDGWEIADRTSHPAWMADRWRDAYGAEATDSICAANNLFDGAQLTVPRPGEREDVAASLEAAGVECRPHPLSASTLLVPNTGAVFKSGAFRSGRCYVQDAASALAMEWAAPHLKGRVWDACGAPGGKSVLIAGRDPQAAVFCSDYTPKRLKLVSANRERLGLGNLDLFAADAAAPPFGPTLDAVLVDAPCSATGTVRKTPELKWARNAAALLDKGRKQAALLAGAADAVRPGGVLAYATCSLEPEENWERVAAFLEARSDFEAVPMEPPAAALETGAVLMWPDRPGTLLLPSEHWMGFYLALMRRV